MPQKSKFKSQIKVLDNSSLCGICSCGWKGNAFAQSSGLSAAMTAAQQEIQAHKHLPQPKKTRKKEPGKIEGVT